MRWENGVFLLVHLDFEVVLAAKRWMPWWFHHQERAFKHMYQGKFDHDLTVLPKPGLFEGNHPLLWPQDF